jgi:hypothetical protein
MASREKINEVVVRPLQELARQMFGGENPYLAITPCPICDAWGDRNHAEDCPNG